MASKYRHMLVGESRIWDRYIEKFGLPEGEINYDVHLGDGAEADPSWPEWMKGMVYALSTHRADVVVEWATEVLIVEIKSTAGMGTVGQLAGYEALWLRDRGVDRPVRLMVVCENLEADMAAVFAFYEMEVVVLGPE